MHEQWKPLLLLALLGGLSLVLGFFVLDFWIGLAVIRWIAYPTILISIVLFVYYGVRIALRYRTELRHIYFNRSALVTLPVLFILCFVNQPLGYKTVMDEIVLAGTARQLHLDREPLTPIKALFGRNYLIVSNAYLDKRPLFFPTLISIVHDFTGYRPANAFYLNMFLALLAMLILWGIAYRAGGPPLAIFGSLLMATVTLLPMMATGGGFEVANFLWTIFFFLGAWAYLHSPDRTTLSFFVLATILLSQLRYESATYIFFNGAIVLWGWIAVRRIVTSPVLVAAPLFLFYLPLQHKVFQEETTFYQLHDIEGADTVFALRYVPDNLGHALNYFLSVEPFMPTSPLLAIVGFIGVAFTALLVRHWLRGDSFERATGAFWLILAFQCMLMLSYFWGRLDDPVIHRMAFPFWLFFWFGAVFLFRPLLRKPKLSPTLISVLALYFAWHTMPLLSKHQFSTYHAPAAMFNHFAQWARDNHDTRTLIISESSIFWITENFAAFSIKNPPEDLEFLHFLKAHNIYHRFVVFEPTEFDEELGQFVPTAHTKVHENLLREEFYHHAIDHRFGGRLSLVTEIVVPEDLSETDELVAAEDSPND